jgi:hypothetical protein
VRDDADGSEPSTEELADGGAAALRNVPAVGIPVVTL